MRQTQAHDPAVYRELCSRHITRDFNCEKPDLNRFLHQFVCASQRASLTQTYVLCREDQSVMACYSLTVGQVDHKDTHAA